MNSIEKSSHPQHVILYFQVHQPRRLRTINFFDIANEPSYFNDQLNEAIVRRVAAECYIPANKLLLELIKEYPQLKITFSISGVVIEQLQAYAPEALETFQELARTGSVEFLCETYYHSLAGLINTEEFETQVLQHAEKMVELFGVRPTVFRNTELIYSNEIGKRVARLGFRAVFTEGHESVLRGASPHHLYCHPEHEELKIFFRNYRLSDDIAFRFIQDGRPLRIGQYMEWLNAMPGGEELINIAMDYETFGEHQKAGTGIFDFLRQLLTNLARSPKFQLALPSDVVDQLSAKEPMSVEGCLSWGDLERDLSAWLGNDMQKDAFNSVMKLEKDVKALPHHTLLECWRYLQTSDHFYYMSIKSDTDGCVHSYFSPFHSSYEAFISFMNVVTHFNFRIQTERTRAAETPAHDLSGCEAERQEVKANTPVWVRNLESAPQANVPDVLH